MTISIFLVRQGQRGIGPSLQCHMETLKLTGVDLAKTSKVLKVTTGTLYHGPGDAKGENGNTVPWPGRKTVQPCVLGAASGIEYTCLPSFMKPCNLSRNYAV